MPTAADLARPRLSLLRGPSLPTACSSLARSPAKEDHAIIQTPMASTPSMPIHAHPCPSIPMLARYSTSAHIRAPRSL